MERPMIDSKYKQQYEKIFKQLLAEVNGGVHYEAALPSYTHNNRLMSWLFWKRVNVALSMGGDLHGKRVLDFGCGGGVIFKYLAEMNCYITGCDNEFNEYVSKICKELNVEANICNDLFSIPDDEFDCVFALDVLEHVEDLDMYIDKLFDVCKVGGKIIVSGPTESIPYQIGRWMSGFSGDYHVCNIYDIEKKLIQKKLRRDGISCLYRPLTLFRLSSWIK